MPSRGVTVTANKLANLGQSSQESNLSLLGQSSSGMYCRGPWVFLSQQPRLRSQGCRRNLTQRPGLAVQPRNARRQAQLGRRWRGTASHQRPSRRSCSRRLPRRLGQRQRRWRWQSPRTKRRQRWPCGGAGRPASSSRRAWRARQSFPAARPVPFLQEAALRLP